MRHSANLYRIRQILLCIVCVISLAIFNLISNGIHCYALSIIYDSSSEFANGSFINISNSGTADSPSLGLTGSPLGSDANTLGLWHMDEADHNDAFTGTTINTVNWGTYGDVTQNDRLIMTTTATNEAASGVTSNSTYTLPNDFDIQVDYDASNWTANPTTDGWYLALAAHSGSNIYLVSFQKNTGGTLDIRTWQTETGANWGAVTSGISSYTGKLRLVKKGTIIHAYYYTTSWIEVGTGYTASHINDTATTAYISTQNRTSMDAVPQTYFDNFKINSVDDSSVNDLHGVNGGATIVTGKYGNALSFNGSTAYVGMGDNADVGTKDFSLEAWINTTTTTGSMIIAKLYGPSGYYMYVNADGTVTSKISNSADSRLAATSINKINDGKWHYVAATYDRDGMLSIYVDGVFENAVSIAAYANENISNAYALSLGANCNSSYTCGNYLNGAIDEVRIEGRVLTPAEIKAAAGLSTSGTYTSGVIDLGESIMSIDSISWGESGVATGNGENPYSTDGLISQWNFNETSGTTAASSAGSCGSACNGTLTSFSNTSGQDVVPGSGWTASNKKWGTGAIMLNSSGGYITTAGNTVSGVTSQFSVETWFNDRGYVGSTTEHSLINKGTGWGDHLSYLLHNTISGTYQGQNCLEFIISTTGTDINAAQACNISYNTWHYAVGTYDGSKVRLYVDGVLRTETAMTGNIFQSNLPTYVGIPYSGSNTWGLFNGYIDTTRFYSRTLTDSEILSNYQAENIELQTRTSADGSTWEEWSPATTSATMLTNDSNSTAANVYNWATEISATNLNWYKYDNSIPAASNTTGTNGRIPLGTSGSGDTWLAYLPAVIKDDSTYKMWYSAKEVSTNGFKIYYATSPDGLTWTKYDNSIPAASNTTSSNGRLSNGVNGGDSYGVSKPAVMKDGSTYKMWYIGQTSETSTMVFYATSPDGLTWTKLDNSVPAASSTTTTNGRIPVGLSGSGDSGQVSHPSVIKDGSAYKMWYSGSDGTNWRIFYATSTDGLTWTKYDNSVPAASDIAGTNGRIPLGGSGSGDSVNAMSPQVVKEGSLYKMWYSGYNGTNWGTYYATSYDCLTWTKYDNSLPAESNTVGTNGRLPSGLTGSGDDARSVFPSILLDNGVYKLWYTGSDSGGVSRIYYATLGSSSVSTADDKVLSTDGTTSLNISNGRLLPDAATVALWHLDETGGSGSYYKDSSANGINLAVNGTVSSVDGISGKGVSFTSSADNKLTATASAATALNIGSSDFTISFWIKPNDWADYRNVLLYGYYQVNGWTVQYNSTGTMIFSSNQSGAAEQINSFPGALAIGVWQNVVITRSGTAVRIYINGVDVTANATLAISNPTNSTYDLFIGGGAYYTSNSTLDEIYISKVARSESEIAQIYNLGKNYILSREISSTDLTSDNKVLLNIASDRPGTFLTATIGESAFANGIADSNTVGLWHLDSDNKTTTNSVTSGPLSPATTTAYTSTPGTITFSNPSYAVSSNNQYASVSVTSGAVSRYLGVSNLGFTIPENAVIDGITVEIERYSSVASRIKDSEVKLIKSNGVVGATNKANSSYWASSDPNAYTSYGGANDLWGEAWTPADINNSNFGAVVNVTSVGGTAVANIDHIRVTVRYHLAGIATDSSASTNPGIVNGTTPTDGYIGGARNFDNTDDFISVPDSDTLDVTNDITFSAWVYPAATIDNYGAVLRKDAAYLIDKVDPNTFRAGVYVSGGWYTTTTISYNPQQWNYVVGTYSSSTHTLNLYINGSLAATNTILGLGSYTINASSSALCIGSAYCTAEYSFGGKIDEVRVDKTVKTANEIKQAYEIGSRTHAITFKFRANLLSSDLVSNSSDNTFRIDETAYGAGSLISNLAVGDKIIIRENYNGTYYTAQSTVRSIDASTGAVTVCSTYTGATCTTAWISGSTFPSGGQTGFSTKATVFKWQQELFDISSITKTSVDAVNQIALKFTDGSSGANVWVDDIGASSGYLSNPTANQVSSSLQRYIQYRAIVSTTDPNVSASLKSVTINYTGGNVIEHVNQNTIIPLLAGENEWGTDLRSAGQTDIKSVGIVDSVHSSKRLATMQVNFNGTVDWSGVAGESGNNKAFFHADSSIASITGGASTSYTLYVPKGGGSKVLICPGVSSLAAITLNCSGGYYLTENQSYNGATATVATEDSVEYWKVSGLTGTGGMSIIEGLHDSLSRLSVATASDHSLAFGTNYGISAGSDNTIVLSFPEFDLSHLTVSDIELTDENEGARTLASTASATAWGVNINSGTGTITFSVPTGSSGGYAPASQIIIRIGTNAASGVNQIINPADTGSYSEKIILNNTPGETGDIALPIVDSDQVNVTGYVNTFINFDIDTGTTDTDCAYNTCLSHSGGTSAANYVVDLGELNSTWVNKSEDASIMHSDGNNGVINSIYFDLTTNAYNGAALYVKSANGALQGPGTNLIPSVTDGNNIQANDGLYGFQLTDTGSGNGTIVRNLNCTSATTYCGLSTSQQEVFNTNSKPLDNGRIRMDLAAASSYVNNPGNYTDTLTFIAGSTY